MIDLHPWNVRSAPAWLAVFLLSALGWSCGELRAQGSDGWILCEGPPPLGWVWCACELTTNGYEWVCYDEWGTGIPGPPPSTPEDETRSKPTIIPSPASRQGLNIFSTQPRSISGTSRRMKVFRGWDRNHDRVIEEGEHQVFADLLPRFGQGRILELALHQVGPGSAQIFIAIEDVGLVRAEDLDGDGLALSPGEVRVVLGANTSRSVPGATNAVTMDYRRFNRIETARGPRASARVIAWEQNDLCVYVLVDRNLDGDFDDSGERLNIFNAAAVQVGGSIRPVRSGWILNADVAAGILPSCYDPTRLRAELSALAYTRQPGNPFNPTGEALYFASTLAPRTGGGDRHGLIYRGIDRNGDRDVNDAGEVTLFYDPSRAANMSFPFKRILDMVAEDLDLFVLQSNGPLGTAGGDIPTLWRLRDLNFDGDAMDPGEAHLVFALRREFPVPTELERFPRSSRGPGPLTIRYGWPCAGSQGLPIQTTFGVPQIGSTVSLAALLANVPPTTPALMMLGFSRETFGNRSLPLDLSPLGLGGCWLLQSADFVRAGLTSSQGLLRVNLGAVPANALLAGGNLYTQFLALDPLSAARPVVLSAGVWWRIDF